jgi:hypothetical protein
VRERCVRIAVDSSRPRARGADARTETAGTGAATTSPKTYRSRRRLILHNTYGLAGEEVNRSTKLDSTVSLWLGAHCPDRDCESTLEPPRTRRLGSAPSEFARQLQVNPEGPRVHLHADANFVADLALLRGGVGIIRHGEIVYLRKTGPKCCLVVAVQSGR